MSAVTLDSQGVKLVVYAFELDRIGIDYGDVVALLRQFPGKVKSDFAGAHYDEAVGPLCALGNHGRSEPRVAA